jgi:CRISP-associated protein Cas1
MKYQRRSIPAKLISLSQRLPFYYAERCKIFVKDDVLVVADAVDGIKSVPAAMVGALLLGPGCNITTEAARLAAENGMNIVFTGGGGVPAFSHIRYHRSATPLLKQFDIVSDPVKRLKAAKNLLAARAKVVQNGTYDLPPLRVPSEPENLQSLLGFEAAWVKRAYHMHAKRLGVVWEGKRALNDKKHPLILLNHFCYCIADVVIEHMGLNPNLGVLHGATRGGGFTYDLADILKPELALGPGLVASVREDLARPGKVKESFLSDVRRTDAFGLLVSVVEEFLELARVSDSGSAQGHGHVTEEALLQLEEAPWEGLSAINIDPGETGK